MGGASHLHQVEDTDREAYGTVTPSTEMEDTNGSLIAVLPFCQVDGRTTGHPSSFAVAALIILGWVIPGPVFGFSDTWQLMINIGTTIVTFLMVFLIQNTQNRESQAKAVQLKLDELIRAARTAS